jgi:hypothetical protein
VVTEVTDHVELMKQWFYEEVNKSQGTAAKNSALNIMNS